MTRPVVHIKLYNQDVKNVITYNIIKKDEYPYEDDMTFRSIEHRYTIMISSIYKTMYPIDVSNRFDMVYVNTYTAKQTRCVRTFSKMYMILQKHSTLYSNDTQFVKLA